MGRRYNPNLAKIHRNYTVSEIGDLFGVHKNTVREWIKSGLPTSDGGKPSLILGGELRSFLQLMNTKHKKSCKPFEFYCVRCRSPQRPQKNRVDYVANDSKKGRLIGICPNCEGLVNRFASVTSLDGLAQYLDITFKIAPKRLSDSSCHHLNSDLNT